MVDTHNKHPPTTNNKRKVTERRKGGQQTTVDNSKQQTHFCSHACTPSINTHTHYKHTIAIQNGKPWLTHTRTHTTSHASINLARGITSHHITYDMRVYLTLTRPGMCIQKKKPPAQHDCYCTEMIVKDNPMPQPQRQPQHGPLQYCVVLVKKAALVGIRYAAVAFRNLRDTQPRPRPSPNHIPDAQTLLPRVLSEATVCHTRWNFCQTSRLCRRVRK